MLHIYVAVGKGGTIGIVPPSPTSHVCVEYSASDFTPQIVSSSAAFLPFQSLVVGYTPRSYVHGVSYNYYLIFYLHDNRASFTVCIYCNSNALPLGPAMHTCKYVSLLLNRASSSSVQLVIKNTYRFGNALSIHRTR